MVDSMCEVCRVAFAVVYCRSDDARLCVDCDAGIHSANPVSGRHLRGVLCDRCRRRPAILFCIDEQLSLCQACDWTHHGSSPGFPHRREPLKSYSGVQPEQWKCAHFSETKQIFPPSNFYQQEMSHEQDAIFVEQVLDHDYKLFGEDHPSGNMGQIKFEWNETIGSSQIQTSCLYDIAEIDHKVFLGHDMTLPHLNLPNIDMGFEMLPMGQQQCTVLQSGDVGQCSMINMSEIGEFLNYRVSPTQELASEEKVLLTRHPSRDKAKIRYHGKKKNRRFEKQIRYGSRKARAD